ncbi:phospholipase [Amphibiibacter pelophylacis]|uniref:Phospholipase n=1 Tax=Amphibiibacter pelophylacis TaxID=1799477 RepID=A0ACC6NZ29_9BURK
MAAAALQIFAGPLAREHIRQSGLNPQDIHAIAGAAGGPKGLILGPLDRHIFGHWLAGAQPQARPPVHLIGASIGAWRMASACLPDPVQGLLDLEAAYIAQDYPPGPKGKRPDAATVSRLFARQLAGHMGAETTGLAWTQPVRYALHLVTSRGLGALKDPGRAAMALGYGAAWAANAVNRRHLGRWLRRTVFSSAGAALPFLENAPGDLSTDRVTLNDTNALDALRASCSIPFVLEPVRDIAGSPPGAHWDGGITDYHLRLPWTAGQNGHAPIVLVPHFQPTMVPGWLDKPWRRRHRSDAPMDRVVLLCPSPAWVARLPGGKLPDRQDFATYAIDTPARQQAWRTAVAMSQQLADAWDAWLQRPDVDRVQPL